MTGLIKRMCILKQLKAGFSADGNPVSGVVRVERYGKLSAAQLSLINFAPLAEGKYVCVLCDRQGERLIFPLLPDKTDYRTEASPFDPEKGFCALVCFLRGGIDCVAAGQYGSGAYNLRLLSEGLVNSPALHKNTEKGKAPDPPPMPEKEIVFVRGEGEGFPVKLPRSSSIQPSEENIKHNQKYDDEAVSMENYYGEETDDGTGNIAENHENESSDGAGKTAETDGNTPSANDKAQDVRHPFKFTDGQTYYLKVKDEIEDLFARGEHTDALRAALPESEWVRVADAGGCLVGLVYNDMQVRYVAYALPAGVERVPPKELEGACFLPCDPLDEEKGGYFVLFQDADTGECVRVEQA